MATDLIMFGAGASYGSDTAEVPPLTTGLIDQLVESSPKSWGNVPSDWQNRFREDFEETMREFAKAYPHSLSVLQRAMAAYFFTFQPRDSNLYLSLASRIASSNWDGALASLNYERLLELSLIRAGLHPVGGRPAKGPPEIELCLPHGCCHIFGNVQTSGRGRLSFPGLNIQIRGTGRGARPKIIGDQDEFFRRIAEDSFPPIMCYFEARKRTTSGADFIERNRTRFSELVLHADRIAIVGIRVRPWDSHLWEPLGKAEGRIIYCSGLAAGGEFRAWGREQGRSDADTTLDGYFDASFNQLLSELGIS